MPNFGPRKRTTSKNRRPPAYLARRRAPVAQSPRTHAQFLGSILGHPECMKRMKTAIAETLSTGEEHHTNFNNNGIRPGLLQLDMITAHGPYGHDPGAGKTVAEAKAIRLNGPSGFDFYVHTHPIEYMADRAGHLLSTEDLTEHTAPGIPKSKAPKFFGVIMVPTYRARGALRQSSQMANISFLFGKFPQGFNISNYEHQVSVATRGAGESALTPQTQRQILRGLGFKLYEIKDLPFRADLRDFGFIESLRERIAKTLT